MQSQRIMYYDALNVLGAFGVVCMHFNGVVHRYAPTVEWAQSLVVDCVFYWAVPVFFMLSGATLLRYRERYDTREFLRRRLLRTLVPFLVWSLLALALLVNLGIMDPPMGPRTLVNLVMNTEIITVYWFFIPLFAIYLCMPVLSCLTDGKHDRVLWYAVGLSFLTTSLLPTLLSLVGIRFNAGLSFPLLGGNLVYPVLGYLLSTTEFPGGRRGRIALYLSALAMLALRYASTLLLSNPQAGNYEVFWGYANFPSFILATAVFVFAKNADWHRLIRTPGAERALSKLAGCSLGVYLMHPLVLFWLLDWGGLPETAYVWRFALPLAVFFGCVVLTMVCKHVPVLRRIVP